MANTSGKDVESNGYGNGYFKAVFIAGGIILIFLLIVQILHSRGQAQMFMGPYGFQGAGGQMVGIQGGMGVTQFPMGTMNPMVGGRIGMAPSMNTMVPPPPMIPGQMQAAMRGMRNNDKKNHNIICPNCNWQLTIRRRDGNMRQRMMEPLIHPRCGFCGTLMVYDRMRRNN